MGDANQYGMITPKPPPMENAIAIDPDREMRIPKTQRPLLDCTDGPNEG